MNCRNCGTEIPAGSQFCIHCGQRADEVPPQSEQPPVAYMPPPPLTDPNVQPQPPKKPMSKGMKALIFGGAGAVVLAVVLILVFTLSGGGGPLSGKTVQTRFVNENARFMEALLGDLAVMDTSKMLSEPFEYTTESSTESDGYSADMEIAMAYDKHTLGIMVDQDYGTITVQLSDSLIIDYGGYVQVIEFDSDADLDAAMTLEQRITALFASEGTDVNYLKLIEMLVNSIPEDCFEKTSSSFTLTLNDKDLTDTLNAFAEQVKNDEALDEAFTDTFKGIFGKRYSLSDIAELAAEELESGNYDFEITWELGYDKGAPTSVAISYEDDSGYNDFTLEAGYEATKDGKDIEIALENEYSEFSLEMTTVETRRGVEFEGEIETEYETMTFEGYATQSGNDYAIGLDAEDDYYSYSIEQQGTIQYGMPDKDVEDDRRFEIDTDDAYYVDLSDLF